MFDDFSFDLSLLDFDSNADTTQGNDAGGAAGTPSDDSVIGDGSGFPGDILAATDEDDHDPALMDIYDLQLTKTVTSLGPYGQDSTVSYILVVENQGSITANNIEISEIPNTGLVYVGSDASLNANVNEVSPGVWSVISLAPENTESINVTYTIASNFQSLNLTNEVQITVDDGDDADSDPNTDNSVDEDGDGNGDDDDEDEETITIDQFYDLAIAKNELSTGPYFQNSLITYELLVTNEGTQDAANIQVMDMPAAGLIYVSDNSGSNPNVNALGGLIFEIVDLDFGLSESIQITFQVDPVYQGITILNGTQIIVDDGADVDSDPNTDNTVDEDGDGSGDDDDEDELILTIQQTYDLAITKTEPSSGPYYPGDNITFRLEVQNQGSLNAANIIFVDNPDIDLIFVSDNSGTNPNVTNIFPNTYQIGSLNFGATESVDVTYQVNLGYQGISLLNRVQITVDDGADIDSDPNTDETVDEDGDGSGDDDDEDEIPIAVAQIYDLSITKTLISLGPYFPGDNVTFRIDINNEGTLNANNIEITENPDPGFNYLSNTSGVDPNIVEINSALYNIVSLHITALHPLI